MALKFDEKPNFDKLKMRDQYEEFDNSGDGYGVK